jgi:hypothetical protein
MSSAAAVIGLTYRGTDIQALDGLWLEIVRGLDDIPTVRGRDTTVPGRAGRIPRNRIGDRLELELEGWIAGVGATEALARADYRTNVIAMQVLFDPRLAPGALVATLEDGSVQTINARTLPGMIVDGPEPTQKTVNVVLESVDPDWVPVP